MWFYISLLAFQIKEGEMWFYISLLAFQAIGIMVFRRLAPYIATDEPMSPKMEEFVGYFVYLEVYGLGEKPGNDTEARRIGLERMLAKGEIGQDEYDELIKKLESCSQTQ